MGSYLSDVSLVLGINVIERSQSSTSANFSRSESFELILLSFEDVFCRGSPKREANSVIVICLFSSSFLTMYSISIDR